MRGADTIELSQVEQVWPALINILKTKKISVASYLLEGSPLSFGDGRLTIGFPKNYTLHKEALEKPENRSLIENIAEEILGKKIRVNFITRDIPAEEPAAGAAKDGQKNARYAGSNILKEPFIQSALEVFDGRIVKRNKK